MYLHPSRPSMVDLRISISANDRGNKIDGPHLNPIYRPLKGRLIARHSPSNSAMK
jgi:hypothetical protein